VRIQCSLRTLQPANPSASRALLKPPFKFVKRDAGSEDDVQETHNPFFARELPNHRAAIEKAANWLPEARLIESRLKRTVTELKVALRVAELEAMIAEELINEQASIAAARKRLPAELLIEIFDRVPSKDDNDGLATFRTVVLLSHVCRAWRSLLLAESKYWTHIEFRRPRDAWGGAAFWCYRSEPLASPLAKLEACLERSGTRAVSVVLSADIGLDIGILEPLVATSERWGSLELRSPELIAIPREGGWGHAWVKRLAPLRGQLSSLRTLKIEGHARRGVWNTLDGNSLWQGDFMEIEDRDRIIWFEDAPQLREVALDCVRSPEDLLLLPWNQLESYKEKQTDRLHLLPREHLKSMPRLTALDLDGAWLPKADAGLVELPCLKSLRMALRSTQAPFPLANYDRLGILVLPALQTLELKGGEFAKQQEEGRRLNLNVDACILQLVERSNSTLVDLTLWLSTGLTVEGATRILTSIPTLRLLRVRRETLREDGIMTVEFLTTFTKIPLTLESLTIDGAHGHPRDDYGRLSGAEGWMEQLVKMVDFQFTHRLQVLNIMRASDETCSFRTVDHWQLLQLTQRWPLKKVLYHRNRHHLDLHCRSLADFEHVPTTAPGLEEGAEGL
jgi:hypothetical protein